MWPLARGAGLAEGEAADDILDRSVGSIFDQEDSSALSGAKREYVDKIKASIVQKAAELDGAVRAGKRELEAACLLYERGRYKDAVRVLRAGLDAAGAAQPVCAY